MLNDLLKDQEMTSISLAPTLQGKSGQQQHEFLFWDFGIYNPEYGVWERQMQAIRTDRWKLLRNKLDQAWELYDMDADPFEKQDVASQHQSQVKLLEKMFFQNRTAPIRQHELMIDWVTPFTWENRNRFKNRPIPTFDWIVQNSKPGFHDVAFDQDAVMMGLNVDRETSGLTHVNIAWELKEGRRGYRFIHVCDKDGEILRQVDNSRVVFKGATASEPIVDSFVLTPSQLKSASFVAIGFYDAQRGTSKVVDPLTKKPSFRLNILALQANE